MIVRIVILEGGFVVVVLLEGELKLGMGISILLEYTLVQGTCL